MHNSAVGSCTTLPRRLQRRYTRFARPLLLLAALLLLLLLLVFSCAASWHALSNAAGGQRDLRDEEHPVIQRLLRMQRDDYRSSDKPLFCNDSNSNKRRDELEAVQRGARGRAPRDCDASPAASQLQCPEFGGAHRVLADSGFSIDEFRPHAMQALEEPDGVRRLRTRSPCCALDQTYSFFASVTPAYANQTYYYEGQRTLLEPRRTLDECARERAADEFSSAPYLIIAINTRASRLGRERRKAIRDTWVRDYREQNNVRGGRRVAHVFVMARGEGDEQQRVEREAAAFGDVLQKDVADSYFSHTCKVLALYEWLARRCGRARWLLKGDDDVFVNVRVLLRDLQTLEAERDEGSLYSTSGFIESRTSIQRDPSFKQFLSDEVFPFKYMEFEYVYGFAALTPLQLVLDVLAVSLCVRGVFLDDTFVNGYLPHVLGARVRQWRSLNWRILWNRPRRLAWAYLSAHSVTPELAAAELYATFLERRLPATAAAAADD